MNSETRKEQFKQNMRSWRAKNLERNKEHQKNHDKKRAPWRAEYQRNRKAIGNAIIRDAKNRSCIDCNIQYPWYVMDFDHIRGNKVAAVSKLVHFNPTKLITEIAKCDVVCSNCHRTRTFKRAYGV